MHSSPTKDHRRASTETQTGRRAERAEDAGDARDDARDDARVDEARVECVLSRLAVGVHADEDRLKRPDDARCGHESANVVRANTHHRTRRRLRTRRGHQTRIHQPLCTVTQGRKRERTEDEMHDESNMRTAERFSGSEACSLNGFKPRERQPREGSTGRPARPPRRTRPGYYPGRARPGGARDVRRAADVAPSHAPRGPRSNAAFTAQATHVNLTRGTSHGPQRRCSDCC